jgi:integrase
MDKRPEGVVEKKGRWYYRPTSEREREERARLKLRETIPLGPAGTEEARRKWAEVRGLRDPVVLSGRLVRDLLNAWTMPGPDGKTPLPNAPIRKKDNSVPRSPGTVYQYCWAIRKVLMPRFGNMRYGRTAIEAASGRAIGTVDVQEMLAEVGTTSANLYVGCLSAAFAWAKRTGKTTYNPCEDVARIQQEGRTRAPLAWELEALGAVAEHLALERPALKRLALMIDFEAMSGWRSIDIRKLLRRQLMADGIPSRAQKNGRRQKLLWTPDLRRVIDEALELPGAKRAGVFPLSPIFASRDGKELSGNAFWDSFRELLKLTNATLAECAIPLSIEDLGFHDLRSSAGDDAAEQGQDRAEFLGDSEAVANKHYARRERRIVPLPLKR